MTNTSKNGFRDHVPPSAGFRVPLPIMSVPKGTTDCQTNTSILLQYLRPFRGNVERVNTELMGVVVHQTVTRLSNLEWETRVRVETVLLSFSRVSFEVRGSLVKRTPITWDEHRRRFRSRCLVSSTKHKTTGQYICVKHQKDEQNFFRIHENVETNTRTSTYVLTLLYVFLVSGS